MIDEQGYLQEINERTKIKKFGNVTKYSEDDEHWIEI